MTDLPRRAAALLASLALLAVPARGVLACEMEAAAVGGARGAAHHAATAVHHAGMADHDAATAGHPAAVEAAHHGASFAPSPGAPSDQPELPCDHVVGCAPVALAIDAVHLPDLGAPSASLVPFTAKSARSPVRALEPPPPKR